MLIYIDTREKREAIQKIEAHFQTNNIKYIRTKLPVGDYMNLDNPKVLIDRKYNIAELAANCTSGHKRFKRELERLMEIESRMIILVEQNTYKDRDKTIKVDSIDDLILWEPKYGQICGEQIYRILRSWVSKYPIEVRFCNKKSTGKEIANILKEGR